MDLEATGVSTIVAAAAAGISVRQAQYWADTRLVNPSIREAAGKGVHRRYDLRDVMSLRTVGDLRSRGVSLQACRKVQTLLRNAGDSFSSTRLVAINGKRPDVLIVQNEREAMSLLTSPGQTIFVAAVLPLAEISREVKRDLAAAKRVAKKNARRMGRPRKSKKVRAA